MYVFKIKTSIQIGHDILDSDMIITINHTCVWTLNPHQLSITKQIYEEIVIRSKKKQTKIGWSQKGWCKKTPHIWNVINCKKDKNWCS